MQAELKQKWIGALRGGQYQQGTGQLKGYRTDHYDEDENHVLEDPEYCCLGLLAEVAGLPVESYSGEAFLGDCNPLDTCGLGSEKGDPSDPDYSSEDPGTHTTIQRKLAAMNDNGKSFAEIADWIEANIPAE